MMSSISYTLRFEADMAAFKELHRVPADAQSCHTSLVGGYVVEVTCPWPHSSAS